MDFSILYEDNHLIAVNKPAGVLVQGDQTGDLPLSGQLATYLKEKYNKLGNVYVGVTHRIDRPVSGAVLFCKTSKALTRMNEQFKEGKVGKQYFALTERTPSKINGRLIHYLSRDRKNNVSQALKKKHPGSKEAVLEYLLLAQKEGYNLLNINLLTGRHHQIRAQLAAIGCPIAGDLKYGASAGFGRHIYLHAHKLNFIHPVKKEKITLIAPLPEDNIWKVFNSFYG